MTTPAELMSIYSSQGQLSSFFTDKIGIYSIMSYANKETIYDGITSAATALTNCITAAALTGGIVMIPTTKNGSTYLIDDDITFPSNVSLWSVSGALLKGSVGTETITINGGIDSGIYQIFDNIIVVAGTLIEKSYPEWFGALGNGFNDDTDAIQQAIDIYSDGGIVSFRNTTYNFTSITVTKPKIKIIGSKKTTFKGSIIVGNSTTPFDNFDIMDVSFLDDAIETDKVCIELSYVSVYNINNVRFENFDKAIFFGQYDTFQHVKRGVISNCFFQNVNYCVYGERDSGYADYMIGDFQFTNNQYCEALIKHIHLVGLDGCLIESNTFFFPSYVGESTTKSNNIYIDYCNFVIIDGNDLFEAGEESIKVSRFQNLVISNNNLPWAGQRVESDAIYLSGGDQAGAEFSSSTITGNIIEKATGSGIGIGADCGYISITGNTVVASGSTDFYYGVPALSGTHYGIYNESGSQKITAIGNVTPSNTNNFNGEDIFYDGNYEQIEKNKRKHYTLTYSTDSQTTIDMSGYDILITNISTYDTIASIGGGYEGKEITIYSFNGRTTYKNYNGDVGDNIYLSSASNVLLVSDDVIVLKYISGAWREQRECNTLTYSTTNQTTIHVSGYGVLVTNIDTFDTMASLGGGYQGKELSIYSFNGRTTFKHYVSGTDNIYLSGSVNTLIPTDGMLTLKYVQGAWREISRTY